MRAYNIERVGREIFSAFLASSARVGILCLFFLFLFDLWHPHRGLPPPLSYVSMHPPLTVSRTILFRRGHLPFLSRPFSFAKFIFFAQSQPLIAAAEPACRFREKRRIKTRFSQIAAVFFFLRQIWKRTKKG